MILCEDSVLLIFMFINPVQPDKASAMKKNKAVISVGSNIHPEQNIPLARDLIRQSYDVQKETVFIITKPLGDPDQNDFTNGALLIETDLSFDELKSSLRDIEHQMKRERTGNRNGPRTIDLDIITWNDTVVDEDVFKRDFLQEFIRFLSPGLAGLLQSGR